MKSIYKSDIKNILHLADNYLYKYIIVFRNNNDYHVYYVRKDENLGEVKYKFLKQKFEIVAYYELNSLPNWTKEDELEFITDFGYKLTDKALDFATLKHKGQYRKAINHLPYIIHPQNVAHLVKKYKGDSTHIDSLVAAAYLHDTLEDTDTTYYELVKNFGTEVASLVNEVTTNKDFKNELGKSKYLAMKMNEMTNWALVIKLCDRLDNISDLSTVDKDFRLKYFNETLYIIKYILNNRPLSQPHLTIIRDILHSLNQIKDLCNCQEDINALILKASKIK